MATIEAISGPQTRRASIAVDSVEGGWMSAHLLRCFNKKEDVSESLLGGKTVAQKPKVSLWTLLKYATPKETWLMALGVIMAALSGCAVPVWLILLANGLDKFSNLGFLINAGADLLDVVQKELNNLCIAFAVLGAVSLATGGLYVSIFTYTGEKQALRIKEKFVRSAFHQDATWFDENSRDELPTKVANSMIHISGAIGRQMADLFANFFSSLGCLIVALLLNPPLAFIMLCIVPVVMIFIGIISIFIRRAGRKSGDSFSDAGGLATEVLAGIKTVASLCAEPWAMLTYDDHIGKALKASIRGGFLMGLSTGITSFLFYVTFTFAFFIGTEQVANNSSMTQFVVCLISPWVIDFDLTILPPWLVKILELEDIQDGITEYYKSGACTISGATVMCCIYGVILCATFFGLMAPALQAINMGRQAAVDIFDTINHVPDIDVSEDSGIKLVASTGENEDSEIKSDNKLKGEISFNGLYFAYPTRPKDILYRDFDLTADAGKSLAIVGPSGCGKSTIARLILRFYDPIAGTVSVDGVDLTKLNLAWWRKQVGYVAQEPMMFVGTLYENIALGKPTKAGVTHDDVIAAAKASQCHDFIMEMPEGYNTFYSGASIQLSGGQMQRICIARAIVRNPSILLLDEATSALDTNSERQVQNAIENIRATKDITIITVAHRLSTIVNCDKIAVISDGRIAEQGTHSELFEQGGVYKSLCETQGISADSNFEDNHPATPVGGSIKYSARQSMIKAMTKSLASKEGGVLDDVDVEAGEIPNGGKEKLASKGRLWMLSYPEWGYISIGVLGSLMLGVLPPSEGILTAQIVANFYEVAPDDMLKENRIYILNFLTLGAGAFVGNLFSGCGFSVSGYRLTRRLRKQVFEAMVRKEMGWFDFPEHSVGELTTRLEADAELVSKVNGWALGYRLRIMATLVAGVTIALYYAWQVGLAALCCVPLIMGAAIVQRLCMKREFVKNEGNISPPTLLENGLRGISSVQAYGLEEKLCNDYTISLIPESNGKVTQGAVAGFVFGFSQFAVFVTFAIIFYVGSLLLTSGQVDFAAFFTSVLAIMFGALGIAQVTGDFGAQQEGLSAAQRIFDIVDEPYSDLDPLKTDGEKPEQIEGAISFKDVTFAYPSRPNHYVYKPSQDGERLGFSLDIKPKQSVAFVGKSGCGKSTALQLFLKFYEASSGTVMLDDMNVMDINTKWIRDQVGYVGQMPTLFAGTVRDNILMGKPDATDEEIEAAAIAANAHDFTMSLKMGYDTDIGNGGMLLSGGQRQRVAIARAIISNPKILVLDEATAALDNESERIVQAALDDLQKKQSRTTLVVAHRLVTVQNCDLICVLDGGGVKELGTHQELLDMNELYHELWMKQGG
mmetsp:Transcript_23253/g.34328  ORF Transcript_23253/g.34328 Transcript_23253/m.34328 type:complete len:1363 (+) Transcript_23253:161-4249(+)